MRIKKITNSLEERFDNTYTKEKHFNDHVTIDGKSNDPKYPNKLTFTYEQFPDSDTYEKAADKFARTPISSDVLGYIRQDGKHTKYKKSTKEFIVYNIENGIPIDITYFPCERSYWDNQKNKTDHSGNPSKEAYLKSIDPEKDVK